MELIATAPGLMVAFQLQEGVKGTAESVSFLRKAKAFPGALVDWLLWFTSQNHATQPSITTRDPGKYLPFPAYIGEVDVSLPILFFLMRLKNVWVSQPTTTSSTAKSIIQLNIDLWTNNSFTVYWCLLAHNLWPATKVSPPNYGSKMVNKILSSNQFFLKIRSYHYIILVTDKYSQFHGMLHCWQSIVKHYDFENHMWRKELYNF